MNIQEQVEESTIGYFGSLQTKPSLSSFGVYFTLIKSMVGTGILYFPRSFYRGGVLFSSIACITVSYFTFLCMFWLSMAHTTYEGTYAEIAGKAVGKIGVYSVDFMIFVTQVGPGLLAVGFILTNSTKSLNSLGLGTEEYQILLVLLGLLIPLCLLKTLREQTWAFLLADMIILVNVIIIGIYSSVSGGSSSNMKIISGDGAIFTLGVLVYGFEGIALTIPIKSEMANPHDFNKVLGYMMGTLVVAFLWFANLGVYSYGSDLKDLITLNLPNEKWVAVMILMYVSAVILGLPMVLYPAFKIIDQYLHIDGVKSNCIRVGLVIAVAGAGYLARDSLGLCVSIIGGLFCAPLAFIFPSIIHLKLMVKNTKERIAAWAMIILGVFFGVTAVISTVNSALE